MDSERRASELIARYIEGMASGPELAELTLRIVHEPMVADAFAEATRFDQGLLEYFGNDRTARERRQLFEDANVIVERAVAAPETLEHRPLRGPRPASRHRLGFAGAAAVAAIVVALVVGIAPHDRRRDERRRDEGNPVAGGRLPPDKGSILLDVETAALGNPVATITEMIGARFTRAGFAPAVGDQFHTGVYRLTSGIVQLTFAHSPEIILEAPCEFDLKGRELMSLHRGKVSAKVPKGAGEFTIETPSATVIDQGTEFAVQVDDKDDSEVHVFDGQVSVTPRCGGSPDPTILHGQSASAIGKKSATPCGIDVDADRFLRSLSEPDSNYARLVLGWNPVLYYRMIPAGEIIHDSGPLRIEASLVRGESEGTPWTVGRIGSALQLGGPSRKDYAVVADYPKTTDGTLSAVAWVFARSRPRSATIAKNWAGEEHGQFHFGLCHDTGELEVYLCDRAGRVVSARDRTPLSIGRWQHVAFVADGALLRLYRNGVEVCSVPHDGIIASPKPTVMGIGVQLNRDGSQPDILRLNDDDPGISDYWHGRIDEFALFNSPLTPQQVRQLYEETD